MGGRLGPILPPVMFLSESFSNAPIWQKHSQFLKTSRMSCMLMCLRLFCVATLIQSASSDDGVLVECNKTVEVREGETVTLNCTIKYMQQSCMGDYYHWGNTHGNIRDLKKYSCEWDNLTYASLTISNVTEEENYTLYIETDCGRAQSLAIKVQVNSIPRSNRPTKPPTSTPPYLIQILLGVFIAVVVFGLLVLMIRLIIIKRLKIQADTSNMDNAPGSEDSSLIA